MYSLSRQLLPQFKIPGYAWGLKLQTTQKILGNALYFAKQVLRVLNDCGQESNGK